MGPSTCKRPFTRTPLSAGKDFVMVVAFAASLSSFPSPRIAGEARFRRGDVDGSGEVDISDGVSVFNYLFLGAASPSCLDAMDSNDDGAHDITDGIFLLNWLFLGGPVPPPPSPDAPCAGFDPTPDAIGCDQGEPAGDALAAAELFVAVAPPAGVRQRSRELWPVDGSGAYVVPQGADFVLLLEARQNQVSRATFSLLAAGSQGADPAVLDVRCDGDLGDVAAGDPAPGGIAAGENLAPFFGREIDLWSDRIYLLEHLGMRVGGADPWSPAPGVYRFTTHVTDDACATSKAHIAVLRVEASRAPVLALWVEDGAVPGGVPLSHEPGSGRVRLDAGGDLRLVVEAAANPHGGPDPNLATLAVSAEPGFAGGADLTARFAPVEGRPGRFAMALEAPWFPVTGDTRITARVATVAEALETTRDFTLEVAVDYATAIQPIWTARCTGCHEAPNPFQGLELVHPDPARTRRNIVHRFATEPVFGSLAERLVRPFFPERSYLWRKLEGTHLAPEVGGEGDRMPQGEEPLGPEPMRLTESWIRQGAQ
jgi:hypothetical protein